MHHLKSYQLAAEFYGEAKGIELPYYVKDQLRRAALSIALNLSEATGKRSMRDRVRFFEIAMGSIRECQSITELESHAFTALQKDLLDHLAASTFKLIRNSAIQKPNRLPPSASHLPLASAALFRKNRHFDQTNLFGNGFGVGSLPYLTYGFPFLRYDMKMTHLM